MSCESDCIISVQILPLFVFTNCYLSRTGSFLVPEALLGLPVPIVHFQLTSNVTSKSSQSSCSGHFIFINLGLPLKLKNKDLVKHVGFIPVYTWNIGHEKRTVQRKQKKNYYCEALWCILSLNPPFQTNKITWCEYYAVFRSHAHYATGLCRIIRQDADFLAFLGSLGFITFYQRRNSDSVIGGIGIILTLHFKLYIFK